MADMATLREQLAKSLGENVPYIKGKNLWIWGAGDTAALYQQGLARLETEGFYIEGYVDRDLRKQGKTISNKSIYSPEVLKNKIGICVLICSIREDALKEVKEELTKWNIENYFLDEVVLKSHAREVLTCYDLLADETSKEVYASIIMQRITAQKVDYPVDYARDYFYFSDFGKPDKDEVLIDCGAYIGDTIADYCEVKQGIFKKIISFEGDAVNFKRLESNVEQLKKKYGLAPDCIELHNCAVSDKMGTVNFTRYEENNGIGSKITDDKTEGDCQMICLDEYIKEPYTFLKADIESFEYRMLCGAKRGIQAYKPKMAICIYHSAIDLYSIPLLIKEILPEYHFAVRHHADDLSGTVLYIK